MADTCAVYTYAGITINGPVTTDTLIIDEENGAIEGLDGAPIRRQVDPVVGGDGGESQPAHFAHRIITFRGIVHIGTVANPIASRSAYLDALMDLQDSVIAALEGQLETNSALAWVQSNGNSQSIQCKYGMPGGEIKFAGHAYKTTFEFQLLAENPTIS